MEWGSVAMELADCQEYVGTLRSFIPSDQRNTSEEDFDVNRN